MMTSDGDVTNNEALLDAGAAPSAAALASQGIRPGPPPAVITSTIIVLAVLMWLALPALASAHNWWSDAGELKEVLKANWDLNWAMTGAALTTIGYYLSPQGPLGGAAPPTLEELSRLPGAVFGSSEPPPEWADPADAPRPPAIGPQGPGRR